VLSLPDENHFIRLSAVDSDEFTSVVSFWRIMYGAARPGHALYLKSELTEGYWHIYSDNLAATRWLQSTIQGMLNPEVRDVTIAVIDAQFMTSGDPRSTHIE
jgi:hypothetical protein